MSRNILGFVLGGCLLAALGAGAYFTRGWWLPAGDADDHDHAAPVALGEQKYVKLSKQARKNLGFVSKPLKLQTYWRTIQVPGQIVVRPGASDRAVTAPAGGVVTRVHAVPGDIVLPGDKLFTLRLQNEYVQNAQHDLFKTAREIELVKAQHERLAALAKTGVVPEMKILELDSQLKRLAGALLAYKQDLLTHGLKEDQIEGVRQGRYVTEIDVEAPALSADSPTSHVALQQAPLTYGLEIQELKVDVGHQVAVGQPLCRLANFQALYIEGRAFKREAPLLAAAAEHAWPVRVDFEEDAAASWPTREQTLAIRHIANAVDPASRTFAFYVALANEARTYEKEGRTFAVWRYRPGQRVQLFVPVEQWQDVFVVPAAALVREGPEAYVFRQNGDLFDRREVHVLYEDAQNAVLARDANLTPGLYIAQGAAASLNRVLKAQSGSNSGLPPGWHMHADGTIHAPH